ncbi:hypothetical protein ACWKWW_14070 [Chryseobacterium cucumeris]
MKKIRKYLKKNEIYFTTICTLLLSLMAIIVSIKSCQITDRQNQMDYFEKHPDFQISKEYKFNDKTKKYDENELVIRKLSGKAKNIEIETISFFDISYNTNENITKSKRFLLYHYYDTTYLYGSNEGIIQRETAYKNNSRAINFEKKIDTTLRKRQQYSYSKISTFMKIEYLNFQNEKKIEYYDVSFNNGKLLNSDTIPKYFQKDNKIFKFENTIDLKDIENMDGDLIKVINQIK